MPEILDVSVALGYGRSLGYHLVLTAPDARRHQREPLLKRAALSVPGPCWSMRLVS